MGELLEQTAFSTLNYECVLEFSLLEARARVDYFGAGEHGEVPVWKLHGSCNMFSHQLKASEGILYGKNVTFEGGIEAPLDRNDIARQCLTGTALAPAMCLYMAGKPLAISPSVIRAVQTLWAETVAKSQAVICVGVRPHVPDVHVWAPLGAVLLFDVDDLKGINDQYGHTVGDLALGLVAASVEALLRSTDVLARYGGDEFAILCPGVALQAGLGLGERIRARMKDLRVPSSGGDVRCTVSVGGAAEAGTGRYTSLIAAADRALYRAKVSGRNRVAS